VNTRFQTGSLRWSAVGLIASLLATGCQTARTAAFLRPEAPTYCAPEDAGEAGDAVRQTGHAVQAAPDDTPPPETPLGVVVPPEADSATPPALEPAFTTLAELEEYAAQHNPALRRMQHEAEAAWEKSRYVDKLPEPTVGSTFWLPPMNFEPDRQVAELQVMQMLPWLGRLKAEARRACLEALAAENAYQAERLRVVGEIRVNWFRLYVLGKQIETTEADQSLLESLVKTANARVAAGDAQPGDVLMAMLEMSSLEEQRLSYQQQAAATTSELNRLLGRDAALPIPFPASVESELPPWDHALLRQAAWESQPELNAARLRSAAARWGVEAAWLNRRPDLTLGAGWVFMDAPGAAMPGAGRDSLMLSVSTTLPIWKKKYSAMHAEADRQLMAAQAAEEEVAVRIDAALYDLWQQALASHKTVELYERSILPQARQTFEADQKSLVNNTVTFDRVIRDFRTLLNLELGYHRALGQQAAAVARIRQIVGADLAAPAAARSEPSP